MRARLYIVEHLLRISTVYLGVDYINWLILSIVWSSKQNEYAPASVLFIAHALLLFGWSHSLHWETSDVPLDMRIICMRIMAFYVQMHKCQQWEIITCSPYSSLNSNFTLFCTCAFLTSGVVRSLLIVSDKRTIRSSTLLRSASVLMGSDCNATIAYLTTIEQVGNKLVL